MPTPLLGQEVTDPSPGKLSPCSTSGLEFSPCHKPHGKHLGIQTPPGTAHPPSQCPPSPRQCPGRLRCRRAQPSLLLPSAAGKLLPGNSSSRESRSLPGEKLLPGRTWSGRTAQSTPLALHPEQRCSGSQDKDALHCRVRDVLDPWIRMSHSAGQGCSGP